MFPCLLALGGRLVLRSNWPVYCDEFEQAVAGAAAVVRARFEAAGRDAPADLRAASVSSSSSSSSTTSAPSAPLTERTSLASPPTALTHFERKYAAAGQALHQLQVRWASRSPGERRDLLGVLAGTGGGGGGGSGSDMEEVK